MTIRNDENPGSYETERRYEKIVQPVAKNAIRYAPETALLNFGIFQRNVIKFACSPLRRISPTVQLSSDLTGAQFLTIVKIDNF